MQRPLVSIIIPAYNEEATIAQILKKVSDTKFPEHRKEIIVINDGSTDRTNTIILSLISRVNKYIRLKKNSGKGRAIKVGLRAASGDLVLIQDADLEYDPRAYPSLVKPFKNSGVHAVYGSRELKHNPRSSRLFYYGGKAITVFCNFIYGSHLTDVTTGFKVFRKKSLSSLDFKSKGFSFCAEVTALILKHNLQIIEVPISYQPRTIKEGKKIRFSDGLASLITLLAVFIKK